MTGTNTYPPIHPATGFELNRRVRTPDGNKVFMEGGFKPALQDGVNDEPILLALPPAMQYIITASKNAPLTASHHLKPST